MKKWLSMLMALVMVLSMASVALAEEATPAETPVKVEEPVHTEEPIKTEEPEKTEEPAQAEEPVKIEEPEKTEEPETVEAPAQEAPINKEATPQEALDPEAVLLSEIKDALNPGRSIQLFARWDGDELFIGDEVRLKVELKGYDDVTYTLEWQYNVNPADPKNEWKTYTSGIEKSIAFTLDETNCEYYWRVLVNITGVKH